MVTKTFRTKVRVNIPVEEDTYNIVANITAEVVGEEITEEDGITDVLNTEVLDIRDIELDSIELNGVDVNISEETEYKIKEIIFYSEDVEEQIIDEAESDNDGWE